MIIPAQALRILRPVVPFMERTVSQGMTFGVGPAGYDVRVREELHLPPGAFVLASTFEEFFMPMDIMAFVHDKSTWARRGLALQNTVIEPGWTGFLTLELTNHSGDVLPIPAMSPIAQIVFHRLEAATDAPYRGKYQMQPPEPVPAIHEGE